MKGFAHDRREHCNANPTAGGVTPKVPAPARGIRENAARGLPDARVPPHSRPMRYLVKARVKPGREEALLRAIRDGSLGRGSIAGDEYLHNMRTARRREDGTAVWVEVCFCAEPLAEERAYWAEFFELESVKDAHARSNCRHENGTEPWACGECDCTKKLEEKLQAEGQPLLATLLSDAPPAISPGIGRPA